MSISMKD